MIKIINGEKSYANPILKNINLQISKGDLISITGKSGSGKSTLLNIISLLDDLTNGEYYFNGINVTKISDRKKAEMRNRLIGYLFQAYHLIPNMNVIENMKLPLLYQNSHLSKKQMNMICEELLIKFELDSLKDQNVDLLSGGEMQRVALARALIHDPELLICDEPTGNLDETNSMLIMNHLCELNQKGKTIVIVTHDPKIANQCRRRWYIENLTVKGYGDD